MPYPFPFVIITLSDSLQPIPFWELTMKAVKKSFQLGYYIGEQVFSDKLSGYSELVSASLIIILGIYELFI